MIDLRLGKYQDVLQDVECDAVICDPPYGDITHTGNSGMDARFDRQNISYNHWTPDDVREFVGFWSCRARGWIAAMTSDDLIYAWRESYAEYGRADFAPVPILSHRPRLGGDGPGSGAVYLMVARPRKKFFMSWGSLPCWYISNKEPGTFIGGKPLRLMQGIVRHYSKDGDVVCDPCAGSATTLLAAASQGRKAIGAEMDPETYQKAKERIEAGYTEDMFVA